MGGTSAGYKPSSSARARCLATVSSDIVPAVSDRARVLKDFGGSVEMPLKANFGGEGGASGSSSTAPREEYGTAGHEAPEPGVLSRQQSERSRDSTNQTDLARGGDDSFDSGGDTALEERYERTEATDCWRWCAMTSGVKSIDFRRRGENCARVCTQRHPTNQCYLSPTEAGIHAPSQSRQAVPT